jgi:hypothetical protein
MDPLNGDFATNLNSIVWNVLLMAIFAIQHTIMARPFFKRLLIRDLERSIFVLTSSLILHVFCK